MTGLDPQAAGNRLGKTTIGRHIDIMKSPCINICEIDQASQLCTGCWRSLDEIASWGQYSDQQRQTVLDDLVTRRLKHTGSGAGK